MQRCLAGCFATQQWESLQASAHLPQDGSRKASALVQPQLEVARVAVQLQLEESAAEHRQDATVARRGATSVVDDRFLVADLQDELRLLDGPAAQGGLSE